MQSCRVGNIIILKILIISRHLIIKKDIAVIKRGTDVMKKRLTILLLIAVMLIGSIATIEGATRIKTTDIRLGGKNRIETGLKCADEILRRTGKFKTVVVAYAQNFPDALAGGYLAKVKSAPIVLTNDLNAQNTFNYIRSKAEPKAKVYLLGGTGVIGNALETSLKAGGFNVTRLGGSNRYETNLKILAEANAKGIELLVASSTGYADSLSGSSVGKPILLVGDSLTAEHKAFLKSGRFTKIYILGGNGAVSGSVEAALRAYAPTERLGGHNRFETSKLIADKFFPKADTVVLAYAHDFPDGLTGGALGNFLNAPVLLVTDGIYKDAHNYVVSKKVTKSFTMGGTSVIAAKTVDAIMEQYEGGTPSNPTNSTHTHTFEAGWSKDADYHWHSATCSLNDACQTAVSDKAKHTWKEVTEYEEKKVEIMKTEVHYICYTCGYDFTENQSDQTALTAHRKQHMNNNEAAHDGTATIEVGTGEFEVISVPIKKYQECTICGYRQG